MCTKCSLWFNVFLILAWIFKNTNKKKDIVIIFPKLNSCYILNTLQWFQFYHLLNLSIMNQDWHSRKRVFISFLFDIYNNIKAFTKPLVMIHYLNHSIRVSEKEKLLGPQMWLIFRAFAYSVQNNVSIL